MPNQPVDKDSLVKVGKIGSPHGVRGWVKVQSYTNPIDNILTYAPWYREENGQMKEVEVIESRVQVNGIIAHLKHCDDRDQAKLLTHSMIYVERALFSECQDGEYYWTDLEGLTVINQDNISMGTVDHLMETGSNDILVVKGDKERLIPYLENDVILQVDLNEKVIRVNWDPNF